MTEDWKPKLISSYRKLEGQKNPLRAHAVPKGMTPVYVKQWRTIILVPDGVVERAKAALALPPSERGSQ